MKYFVTLPSGRELAVDISESASGVERVSVDGVSVNADATTYASANTARQGRGATSVRVDGQVVELWLESDPPNVGVIANGQRFFAKVESERMRIRAAARPRQASEGMLKSPMPGRVLRVLVAEGDEVVEGAAVVVVEAMKMENELGAGRSGKVLKILVTAGATVEGGQSLLEIG